jgi:uncharacterized membrane protein
LEAGPVISPPPLAATIEDMLALFAARHRAHAPLFAALVVASAACSALVAARVTHTGRTTYTFLVYNLALAWIPVAFAAAAYALGGVRSRTSAVLLAGCSAGWLLFFPNAPYLVTDLVHLKVHANRLFWFDVLTLPSFAWTGMALGFLSLFLMQRLVEDRAGRVWSWLFVGVALPAAAFGIYLGRFRRWNSWDLVLDPVSLVADVLGTLLHPAQNAAVGAFCAVLAGVMFVAYLVFYAWTSVRARA